MNIAASGPEVALYRGTVSHRRNESPTREFEPKLSLAFVDVDALPASLDRVPLWSARRPAPVWFRRRDFFDGGVGALGEAVRDLVAERLGRRPSGRVHLLAHLRTFGWLHNPLAVYYCRDECDELDSIVLEVTNTPWGERQWYVCDAAGGIGHACSAKAMHVSPFLPMDVEYRISWTDPGTDLVLIIEVVRGRNTLFEARLDLRREPLDRRHTLERLLRDPLPTHRVSLGIYLQAVRLFLARVPRYRHPAPRARRAERAHVRNGEHV